jgi:hypothetical protein
MVVDCDTCQVRGVGCHGCVVTVLLGHPDEQLELAEDVQLALEVLAGGGLVPPLRLVEERRAAG